MMFDILGAHVFIGEALTSTASDAYLRASELSFLRNFVNDSLDLCPWCDPKNKRMPSPTLDENLPSPNVIVAGAGSGEQHVFPFNTYLFSLGLCIVLFYHSSLSRPCK